MKKHITKTLVSGILLLLAVPSIQGQVHKDSTITVTPEGETIVSYFYHPFPVGPSSETRRETRRDTIVLPRSQEDIMITRGHRSSPAQYDVGEIAYQQSVSPTGGKVIQVPIGMLPPATLMPQLNLTYNSQGREGTAGYGWNLSGFSCITLTSRTEYYHGTAKGAYVGMPDACYSLDGMLLAPNEGDLAASYPLRTIQGNILVKKTNEIFEALYPDGKRAVFGETTWTEVTTSYPVKQITDVDGNVVTFSYVYSGGQPFLTEVTYGHVNNGADYNRLELNYVTTNCYTPRYFAGKQMSPDRILSSVNVYGYDDEDPFFTYTLVHQSSEGSARLKEIHLVNQSGAEVTPLLFEYRADNASSNYNLISHTGFLDTIFPDSEPGDIRYIRGRFDANSYTDGFVMFPALPTYSGLRMNIYTGAIEYGSPYPANQVIPVYPKFGADYEVMTSNNLIAGEKLCGIVVADVNGDGVDEILKIHYGYMTSAGVYMDFKIYSANPLVLLETKSVYLPGLIEDGDYKSPPCWQFRTGNFVGDGKTYLLAHAVNLGNNATYSHHLIDFQQSYRLVDVPNNYFPSNTDFYCMDVDLDGVTELCFLTQNGLQAYRYSPGNGFPLYRTFSGISSSDLSQRGKITDINGDGYMDVVLPPEESGYGPYTGSDPDSLQMNIQVFYDRGTNWTVYYNTGKEFISTVFDYDNYLGGEISFCDVDRNGTTDLILKKNGIFSLTLLKNGGLVTSQHASTILASNTADVLFGDEMHFDPNNYLAIVNDTELDDHVVRWYSLSDNQPYRSLLNAFTDSYGKKSEYTYKDMANDADRNFNFLPGFAFQSGSRMIKCVYPIYLLEWDKTRLSENGAYLSQNSYLWYNAYADTRGLGFMGFARYDVTENNGSPYIHKTEYRSPALLGATTRSETRCGSTLTATADYTYDNHTTTYGKLQPRLIKTVSADLLTGFSDTTTVTYGAYDLPSQVTKYTCDGAQSKEAYTYQHSLLADKYFLGLPSQTHKWYKKNREQNDAWNEVQKVQYNGKMHPMIIKDYVAEGMPAHLTFQLPQFNLDSLIVGPEVPGPDPGTDPIGPDPEPDPGVVGPLSLPGLEYYVTTLNLVSTRQLAYDGTGRVTSDKTAPYESTVYVGETCTYDTYGRPATRTDKFGHTTTYGNYNSLGQAGMVTDWRGRTNTVLYDGWGNETQRTNADGTTLQTALAWGGTGLFTRTITVTGKPVTVTHYDAAGREVRASNQRFDGTWQHMDRQYDTRGRLWRESFPFKGNAATIWTTTEYDNYGRPVRVSDPSGRETLWSYSGASTTTTKEGISSTSTVNASGRTVRVADAGGEILYTYNDASNPTKITAPGGVETTFQYDEYGRRRIITDPSAGRQTESYSLNIFTGAMTVTSTNPKGTVITTTDRYGRTTSVNRVNEFTTTYSYNTYGLLAGEVSTNGCSKQYTYDTYDRVTTLIETVPDGNVLGQAYTYGNDGNLASTAFFLGDDPETSEILPSEEYTYAYGHLKQIDSEGVTVWRLVGENALGQPTDVWTGNVMLRSYGFNAYGLPTWRLIEYDTDTISDVDYSFDARTGNLLSRTDNVWNTSESFSYDALNRLTRIRDSEGGDRRMYYDFMGNIAAIDGVGDLSYGNASRPYQVTGLAVETGAAPFQLRQQDITYTCFRRPATLVEGGRSAAFTYNGSDERVKMYVADGTSSVLMRYYLGGRYELDITLGNTREKLYLGGDAYSAPMVYVRDSNSDWVLYDIVRDYQGSITHLVDDSDGTVVAEYSYDPWGRLRDPETLEIYTPGSSTMPDLMLGRGYTAHEHLDWFGLINMNARLYDPALGRFLSPDPYVQAPDFTQNFNRYSYCLNNPLKYTDESGESPILVRLAGAALLGGGLNVACNWDNIDGFWQGVTTFASGAIAGAAVAAVGIVSKSAAVTMLTGMGGGALTSFNNSIVAQTGRNFSGWNSIDWEPVWKSTISGAVSGGISAGIGFGLAKALPLSINGLDISSPLLRSLIVSPVVSAAGYISAYTTYGVLDGQPFWDSFYSSFNKDLLRCMAIGTAIGVTSTVAHCYYEGINPLSGEKAYPPKDGFLGDPHEATLEPGMTVDRYGNEVGNFLAPEGTPFEHRALPPNTNRSEYTRYMVLQPIPVSEGITAPSWWFNSPGGGTQYHLPDGMMKYYIENGYLIKY